jgi:hypothetical protein
MKFQGSMTKQIFLKDPEVYLDKRLKRGKTICKNSVTPSKDKT